MSLKKLLFISSIFCSLLSTKGLLAQTWTALNSGTTANLIDISIQDANTSYISGGAGTLLKTIDGGTSWTSQTSGTTQDLYSIVFTDLNNGYAVGNSGAAIKTTNGGTTWTNMTVPTGTVVSFRYVYFVTDSIGYITGGTPGGIPGTILKTVNAGNTWQSLPVSNVATDGIYSVFFTSQNVGYANDYDGHILKTTNAGASWTAYSTGSTNIFNGNIYFTDSVNGFVSGMNGIIYKTNNQGSSWTASTSGTSDALTGMEFYDANNGFIVGGHVNNNTAKMLKTSDAGATWTTVSLNAGTNRLSKIDFLNSGLGFVVGLNGTILKYVACPYINDWTTLNSGTTASLIDVSIQDANTSYISGGAGTLLKTINGGTSWTPQASGTTQDLYSIVFTDLNNGYAVGNSGAAIKTTNGGATWTNMTVPTGTVVSFRYVYFVTDSIGYITGGTSPGGTPGTILKTVNAGNTWVSLPVSNVATNGIYSVFFTSPNIGYANDYDGHILKTTNAGASWTAYSTGNANIFNGNIYFTDSVNGFVSGMNGIIYKTNNQGSSWTASTSGTIDALTGMEFYDTNNGFIVGGHVNNNTAKMLKTNDAGATWTTVSLNAGTNRLSKIDFLNSGLGFVVGLNGTILKYAPCPPIFSVTTSSINAGAFGVCDGAATATPTPNSLGYSCMWSTGQTTPSISGLCAGTYTVTITDSLGTSITNTVVIAQPADSALIDSTFIISTSSTNVTFAGNCDGTATIVATGGTPPYSYTWSTGDTAVSITNLCSNVYYITVNDSNGQSLSSTVYVSEPNDTITDSISYPPIDTLYIHPIDTCIVDFTAPIDSAYITAFTITDSMTVLVDWTLWQNGIGVTITTEVEYSDLGFNLMVLTLHCSAVERELYSTVVQDVIDTNPVSTGINNRVANTAIKAYPNPVTDKLTIELNLIEKGNVNVQIMNSLGQTVYTTSLYLEKGNKHIVINTEKFDSGIYFVQTIFNGRTSISKIIK